MVSKRSNALDRGKPSAAAAAGPAGSAGRAAAAPDIDVRKLTVSSGLNLPDLSSSRTALAALA